MALVLKDRVQETTSVVGTGTMTLAGAVLGFQSFAAIGNSNTTYYAVFDLVAGDWEVGIGTYTSSGTTLSRTTVLSSSNGGSLVSFTAGTKQVICTYPSERAVWVDSAGTNTVQNVFSSITATTATLTSGTVANAPANPTDIVNKDYADSIASGINFHAACNYATTADLGAATYNNGTSGVGATLTKTAPFSTLAVDGGSPTVGQRILVKNQTSGQYNGAYVVTSVGSGAAGWVLTRATDYDTSGSGQNEIDQGDYLLILSGTANANTSWVQQTGLPITVGTTAIVFLQFAAPITYSAGTGLTLSPSTTFNITNTGVTAASYGIAASVPTLAINAQGQITSASNTAIAIAAAAVSGLATSATTDTTNAANITSGTLPSGRISGSYTGLTGTGALAAGSLATGFTAVSAPLGGTGQTTYTIGDILYASTTTALSKLAAVAVGNVLISNGVGSAPSWGQVGLATSVSGTLPVANGGTGVTSASGTGSVVLNSSPSITSATLTTPTVGSAGATFNGSTSGTTVFKAAAAAGTTTITMPGTTGTMALTSDIPTVSNGTLTMAVSGTGLSGSASFTANQSSASSFTVTSNATNANTASTIVARDASGNFSAGTITAALSGNASTATSATSATSATTAGSITSQANSATITATTASTASSIVLRDGNGYVTNSYFYTSSGGAERNASGMGYFAGFNSSDYYIRSYTPAAVAAAISGQTMNISGSSTSCTGNAATATTFSTGRTNWSGVTNGAVAGQLGWKNYGNSHTIFDASASTNPDGGAVNNTNSANVWSATYPTLMGYNGSSTYGVRVDSARTSDNTTGSSTSCSGNAATANRANGYFYIDQNYGYSVVGLYASTIFQGLYAMGDAYKTGAGGTISNLYGMTWSYPSAGGIAGNLASHGFVVAINGGFGSCMSYNVTASGNVTAYSDERLKRNWEPLCDNFIEKLAKVKVGTYERIDQPVIQVGVSAQSLEKVLPEAVTTSNDEMQTKQVSYGNAALASAVMLAQEVVELKQMMKQMQAELAELKRGM